MGGVKRLAQQTDWARRSSGGWEGEFSHIRCSVVGSHANLIPLGAFAGDTRKVMGSTRGICWRFCGSLAVEATELSSPIKRVQYHPSSLQSREKVGGNKKSRRYCTRRLPGHDRIATSFWNCPKKREKKNNRLETPKTRFANEIARSQWVKG